MSKISITTPVPPQVAGLFIQSGVRSATLRWTPVANAEEDGVVYQVWSSTTNNASDSHMVATGVAPTATINGLDVTTYFWVRAINKYGALGFFSTSVQFSTDLVTTKEVTASAGGPVPSTMTVVENETLTPTTAANDYQWYPVRTLTFTPNDDTLINVGVFIATTVSNVNLGTNGSIEIWASLRLYDNTLNANVPGGTKYWMVYMTGANTWGLPNALTNLHDNYTTGFRGLLVPGHSYTLYAEIMKSEFGTATCTLTGRFTDATWSSAGFA